MSEGEFRVSARWSVQDGRMIKAQVDTFQEIRGALVLLTSEPLVSKVDLSIPGLRRALRRARLATGGIR